MAEEKKIKTCEEYVLNVLAETRNELTLVKKELQETKNALENESSMHKELIDLVVKACKGGKIIADDVGLIKVYLLSGYVNCFFDYGDDNDDRAKSLKALKTLIEMVDAIATRERE